MTRLGVLVPPGDITALRAAIERLFEACAHVVADHGLPAIGERRERLLLAAKGE